MFESAAYITAGGLHLSGLTSGRRTFFLLCPRRSTAKGGCFMTLWNLSSAHVACNCGLRHVRHCVEDLQQQKMTAVPTKLVRSFFVIDLPEGTDRLPDSTFFSCIIPQPAEIATAGLFFFSLTKVSFLSELDLALDVALQLGDGHTHLLHGVAVADGDAVVGGDALGLVAHGVEVHG